MKELRLVHDKGIVFLDDEDYERAKEFNWYRIGEAGAYTRLSGNKSLMMHHFVLGLKSNSGLMVEFLDGDKFNLQKENLRTYTRSEHGASIQKKIKARKLENPDVQHALVVSRKSKKRDSLDELLPPEPSAHERVVQRFGLLPVPFEDGIHYIPMDNIAYVTTDREKEIANVVMQVWDWDHDNRRPKTVSFGVEGTYAALVHEYIRFNTNETVAAAAAELVSLREQVAQLRNENAHLDQERNQLREETKQYKKKLGAFQRLVQQAGVETE